MAGGGRMEKKKKGRTWDWRATPGGRKEKKKKGRKKGLGWARLGWAGLGWSCLGWGRALKPIKINN